MNILIYFTLIHLESYSQLGTDTEDGDCKYLLYAIYDFIVALDKVISFKVTIINYIFLAYSHIHSLTNS